LVEVHLCGLKTPPSGIYGELGRHFRRKESHILYFVVDYGARWGHPYPGCLMYRKLNMCDVRLQ
jgi:hypothetical protein